MKKKKEVDSEGFSRKRVAGIRRTQQLCERLSTEESWIAVAYREGQTLMQIAQRLAEYALSPVVTFNAVRCALEKLLPREEHDRISQEHVEAGRRKAKDLGLGFYNLPADVHRAYADNGRSFISHEDSVRAGKSSAKARGMIPFSPEETLIIMDLGRRPEFQHQKSPHTGKPLFAKILEEVNSLFGNDRTLNSIRLEHNRATKRKG